ncbi:hypothetical protein AB4Y80_10735 [Specibacter sp. RAF43]
MTVLSYGFFQWLFWALAFACGIAALLRIEAFSTTTSQRTHHHPDQQFLLWILTAGFAVSGFVTAALAMRAGH